MALLVNVLGGESPATYPLLLPLLREALHPDSSQPELLEDGLGLWLVAVRNAPSCEAGAPLLEVTPALTACLTYSTGGLFWGGLVVVRRTLINTTQVPPWVEGGSRFL